MKFPVNMVNMFSFRFLNDLKRYLPEMK